MKGTYLWCPDALLPESRNGLLHDWYGRAIGHALRLRYPLIHSCNCVLERRLTRDAICLWIVLGTAAGFHSLTTSIIVLVLLNLLILLILLILLLRLLFEVPHRRHGVGLGMILIHETFQDIQTLLEGSKLVSREDLLVHFGLEETVIEAASHVLFIHAHIPENLANDLDVQSGALLASCVDGHEVHHPLGVQVGFVEAELAHLHVGEMAVEGLLEV